MSDTHKAFRYRPGFRLHWRLAAMYSVLFSVFVIILSIFIYYTISQVLLRNAQIAFPQHAQELRTLLVQQMCDTMPPPTFANFAREYTGNDISEIYLLDRKGNVLASSDGSMLDQHFSYANPIYFVSSSANLSYPFEKPSPGAAPISGLLLPLQAPSNCLASQSMPGYMAVLPSYQNEQETLNTILWMLEITSALMIVFGALLISFFTGMLFSPLKQVTRATRALTRGDLQQRVPPMRSRDELAELATSFNQMADRIEQMFTAQQASERRARRFVSDASHELRTPITSLRGLTEVLLRGAKDDPATATRLLGLMKNEAERMTQLVNDLLTLARLDENHFSAPADVDLVAVAVECLQEARHLAPADCQLTLELATQERLRICADMEQLQRLLQILLKNAIVYGCTGAQKRVHLCLDKKGGHALLQVIDYGVGINADDLPHIFDRFYRGENAHSSASTPIPGTGLGLPIALAITNAYQGTLTAQSTPGQETIFTVSFPCL